MERWVGEREALDELEVGEDGAPAGVGAVIGVGEGGLVEHKAEEGFEVKEEAGGGRRGSWARSDWPSCLRVRPRS